VFYRQATIAQISDALFCSLSRLRERVGERGFSGTAGLFRHFLSATTALSLALSRKRERGLARRGEGKDTPLSGSIPQAGERANW